MTKERKETLKKITEDLKSLSDEEFWSLLKEHMDGDVARMMRHEWERMDECLKDSEEE